MIGRRRRLIKGNQAPRDQFGKKTLGQSSIAGLGYNATVADGIGFVSQGFRSSGSQRTQIIMQKKEDFMDADDFDAMGKSQLEVAEDKPNQYIPEYGDTQVTLLRSVGYSFHDLQENLNGSILFSHQMFPEDSAPEFEIDWDTIQPPSLIFYSASLPPPTFKAENAIKIDPLPGNSLFRSADHEDLNDFNLDTMFHIEGEVQEAKEVYGNNEKRLKMPWEPAKVLRQRFTTDLIGPSSMPEREKRRMKRAENF